MMMMECGKRKNDLAKIETEMWELKDEEEEAVEIGFKHARC